MDNRQYLFKYGEKALQFYKKSLPKQPPNPDSGSDSDQPPMRQTQTNNYQPHKKSVQIKKLVLDETRPPGLKTRKMSKKGLSRSKSKPHLLQAEVSPKNITAAPTLRRPKELCHHSQSNSRKNLHSNSIGNLKRKKQARPTVPFGKANKEELESKIQAALSISDFGTFVSEVLNNINQLIYSESTINKWLKSFKACFERLFAVTEDYISKYARADQEIKRLNNKIKDFEEENRSLSRMVDREKTFEHDTTKIISQLTKKLEKLEKREKLLLNTFEYLKNEEDTEEGHELTPNASRNARVRSSAGKQTSGSKPKDISDYLPPYQ